MLYKVHFNSKIISTSPPTLFYKLTHSPYSILTLCVSVVCVCTCLHALRQGLITQHWANLVLLT